MLLDRFRSIKVAVPVGMAFVVSGLFLVLINSALPYLSPRFVQPTELGDFARGFIVGIGLALEIIGIMVMIPAVLAVRAQRSGNFGK